MYIVRELVWDWYALRFETVNKYAVRPEPRILLVRNPKNWPEPRIHRVRNLPKSNKQNIEPISKVRCENIRGSGRYPRQNETDLNLNYTTSSRSRFGTKYIRASGWTADILGYKPTLHHVEQIVVPEPRIPLVRNPKVNRDMVTIRRKSNLIKIEPIVELN